MQGWARAISTRLVLGLSGLSLVGAIGLGSTAGADDTDPPEVAIGERLFIETRFAQFFASHSTGINAPLGAGDPVVDFTQTTGAPLPGPFAGQSINCRSCHLVDEQLGVPGGGMRTYDDFARRSPIPAREDGRTATPRNSPPLVNASLPRPGGLLLHFDGEFPSLKALVEGTLTGRNYGWLPGEAPLAIAQVARVIREDDGSGALAQQYGGSYASVLGGTDPSVPEEFRVPPAYRIDVANASDTEILHGVAKLIAAYVRQLVFEQDDKGNFIGSPYDHFLELNGLPRQPARGESLDAYNERLQRSVAHLSSPQFVDDGPFEFHDQERIFGATELAGLRVFLARAPDRGLGAKDLQRGGIGNCTACHPAPNFTDFGFHNTGVSQAEYDGVHGDGRFARIAIPSLAQRQRNPNAYLPATAAHPHASEIFRAAASAERVGATDLGAWNTFANPDFPAPQAKLWRALCTSELANSPNPAPARHLPPLFGLLLGLQRCQTPLLLDHAVAVFKAPGLRDLEHSSPYLHNGSADQIEDVLALYRKSSALERSGRLRNGSAPLAGIALVDGDVAPLAAFLRSLDEDYH